MAFIEGLRKVIWRGLYKIGSGSYDTIIAGKFGYRAFEDVCQAYVKHAGEVRGPVLDIGCGTGLTGVSLAKLIDQPIDGIDLSSDMIVQAQKKDVYRHLYQADLTKRLPMEEGSYAGAICAGVFTHGHVGSEALEAVFAVMSENAVLSMTIVDSLWQAEFKEHLEKLQSEGVLKILDVEPLKHFEALKNLQSQLVVIQLTK